MNCIVPTTIKKDKQPLIKTNNQFCDEQPLIKTNKHQSMQTTSIRDNYYRYSRQTSSRQGKQTVIETNNYYRTIISQDKQPVNRDQQPSAQTNNH
jgi:hypothetical protein